MTARVVYIGDRLMAGGFVLSGARVFNPQAEADAVWNSFIKAREDADLILISETYARLISERLERYQQQTAIPPVLKLPETGKNTSPVRATIQAAKTSLGISG
jgi:vacuolar-type H+-ATPase subunit F/Vma7